MSTITNTAFTTALGTLTAYVASKKTNTTSSSTSQKLPSYADFINAAIETGKEIEPYTDTVDASKAYNTASKFTISQLSVKGEPQVTFQFSLLPAIESKLGGGQVPEVKPGILKRSTQTVKTFNIPAGLPVFQILGVEPTILQLVGLFTGSENVTATYTDKIANQPANSKGPIAIYNPKSSLSATWYAEYFDKNMLQVGRPLQLAIVSGNNDYDFGIRIVHNIILQNVRYFIVREDRVYYSMDALVLDYPAVRASSIEATTAPDLKSPADIKVPEPEYGDILKSPYRIFQ